jgi:hypothetical protein
VFTASSPPLGEETETEAEAEAETKEKQNRPNYPGKDHRVLPCAFSFVSASASASVSVSSFPYLLF